MVIQKIYTLKQIETPRLIIRPVQFSDKVELSKSINNSLDSLQVWMPWANDPSLEEITLGIQRVVFAWFSQTIEDFPMVVIHKEDQKIIGGSGYNERSNLNEGLYEIGYWCDIDYQGRGLVTECVNALTRYALNQLEAKTVIIRMGVDNVKSISVAERLNFVNQGVRESAVKDDAFDYRFTCVESDVLPSLKVSWHHEANDGTVAQMIAWAKDILQITDEKAFSDSRIVQKTPWSNVLEMSTGNGLVYLKQTPRDLFLEAEVVKSLHDKCGSADIPEIIASNSECHCFIMKKCGDLTLREYFSGHLDLEIFTQSLEGYNSLQKATIPMVDDLISLGVPDWRLARFSILYDQLISDSIFLTRGGLDSNQHSMLHSYSSKVKILCEKIASYGVPACLNHSDFHDNNIMYDKIKKNTSIIDLGETAITHPFFSIMSCLWAVKNRYDLSESHEDYKSLVNGAFSHWLDDPKHLSATLEMVKVLLPVYLLFAQKRFLESIDLPYDVDDPISVKQYGKIYYFLTLFIDSMDEYYGK